MTDPLSSADRIDGRLVYAIGDVHGRYDLLIALLKQIASDVAVRAAGRRPVMIFCGDYIDRGPDSARVVETLVWLKRDKRFEVRLLKGNHEDAFLGSLEDMRASQRWLQVGGRATLRSYGVSLPGDLDDPKACHKACTDLAQRMPAAHLLLFRDLETMAVIGDYAFVHAGIRSGVPLREQSLRDLMWIREEFLQRTERFEKRIVHGHSWTGRQAGNPPQPDQRRHRRLQDGRSDRRPHPGRRVGCLSDRCRRERFGIGSSVPGWRASMRSGQGGPPRG